jgi:hypothetical protein
MDNKIHKTHPWRLQLQNVSNLRHVFSGYIFLTLFAERHQQGSLDWTYFGSDSARGGTTILMNSSAKTVLINRATEKVLMASLRGSTATSPLNIQMNKWEQCQKNFLTEIKIFFWLACWKRHFCQHSGWFHFSFIFQCFIYITLMIIFKSIGWDYFSELWTSTGLLFIPQVIYVHGETWWNEVDRGKLLICPSELSGNPTSSHLVAGRRNGQREWWIWPCEVFL